MWGCTYDSLAGKKFFTQGNSRKGGEDKKEKHIAQIVQIAGEKSFCSYSEKDVRSNTSINSNVVKKSWRSSRYFQKLFIVFPVVVSSFIVLFLLFFLLLRLSKNDKHSCKNLMLVDCYHFEKNVYLSWGCLYFSMDIALRKIFHWNNYANVSQTTFM